MQRLDCSSVTRLIGLNLVAPEPPTSLRPFEVVAASVPVPETALNLNNRIPLGQDDIRPSRQILRVEPKAQAVSPQTRTNHPLRMTILAAYPRHHARTRPAIDNINHPGKLAPNTEAVRDAN